MWIKTYPIHLDQKNALQSDAEADKKAQYLLWAASLAYFFEDDLT